METMSYPCSPLLSLPTHEESNFFMWSPQVALHENATIHVDHSTDQQPDNVFLDTAAQDYANDWHQQDASDVGVFTYCDERILGQESGNLVAIQEELMEENSLTDLLLTGAEAVEAGDPRFALAVFSRLDGLLLGSPENAAAGSFDRLAYHFAQGLRSRISSASTSCSLPEPLPSDRMSVQQIIQELSPFAKFAHFTANQAILDATKGDTHVNVVDLNIGEGIQWPSLMSDLARHGGMSFHLTAVTADADYTNDVHHESARRLSEFADSLNLPFQYSSLCLHSDEDLHEFFKNSKGSVIFSCDTTSMPYKLLSKLPALLPACVKLLQPKLMVIVEEELVRIGKEASLCKASFVDFFFEALHHFTTVFESLASCFAGGNQGACLRLVEREMVGPRIQDFVGQYGSVTVEVTAPQVLEREGSSQLSTEVLISAVAGDLASRFISFLAHIYDTRTCEDDDRRRLELVLLRIHAVVEEAEGRHITNRRMFLQLKALIQDLGMEVLISAVAGDLVSRFISFLAQSYGTQTCEEEDRRRLERILLRMHMVVEEAEGRHITNRGMFLQLKTLIEGVHLGYYMLDKLKFQPLGEESVEDDEVSHWSQSLAVSTFDAAKRLRFAVAASMMKNTPITFSTRSTTKLKSVLASLEATTADMREFVVLLGSCPRLPRQPYCMHLYMDKCMFGRHVEKEQLINFLLCDDTRHDCAHISILPIIGPHRIGKKTLVQHACKDERVCNRFSHMFFFKGDDLRNEVFALNSQAASGKYLFVVDFIFDVDEAAWTNFQSYLQKLPGAGIKIVVTGRAEQVANLGTAQPIRLRSLSQEEYWYYFKALAFGSTNPDEHPKLASLGMQLAALLQGSFLGANILGELLRANPSTEFWRGVLSSIRGIVREHLLSFGTHPEDLLGRNFPVNFGSAALVGGQAQGYLVYDLREAGPAQSELPKLTSQELLTGRDIPVEDKFEVLVWRSRIPPYCDYVVTYEKQKIHVAARKRQRKC
ncbi:uncharacterized protein LOC119295419 [Triticum dicoccoides]|uniref:uncharacterized protein LOC119295419 n=1 Tax=Triticum dicoccoides TaxID=85692 RepID=UPI00188FC8FE|nr:uncharacterized protein LOC119295419 [Triticum dicoccoides]